MSRQITATVVEGALKLDEPIELPEGSRVRIAIEPLESWRVKYMVGLEQWRSYCEQHPVASGGRRPSRDELHERR